MTAIETELPPALEALKEQARAARRARQKAEEDARTAEVAARRKALVEAAALDLGPELWPFVQQPDIDGVDENTQQVDLGIALPGHRMIFARYRHDTARQDGNTVHTWGRWGMEGHKWQVGSGPLRRFTNDLGEALLLAEDIADDLERDPEIPF